MKVRSKIPVSNIVCSVLCCSFMVSALFVYGNAINRYKEANDILEEAKNVEPIIIEVDKVENEISASEPPVIELKELERQKETLFGNCRITAYCACEKCCGQWANNRPNGIVYGASGDELISEISVACNLPFGTKLKIDGFDQTFIVHDRTANWVQEKYDGMTIDIYIDSHEGCYEFMEGMPDWANVYIVEEA